MTKVPHQTDTSVNMITEGGTCYGPNKENKWFDSLIYYPDPDYNPDLGQVLVEQEGAFQSMRTRVAIPYNYGQPSSSGAMSPESLRYLFQWSDDKGEASGCASSAIISSV